jgi:CBS domain containing-hemolysin-like protein
MTLPPKDTNATTTGDNDGRFVSWLQGLRGRLGLDRGANLRATIEDALRGPAGTEEQQFSPAEREMLLRLLRFGVLRVDDVMVPRADIIAVDENDVLRTLLQVFDTAGVSRVPLYHETLDDLRGMVHIKDLVRLLIADAQGRPATEGRRTGPTRTGAAATLSADAPPLAAKAAAGPASAAIGTDLGRADLSRKISATRLRRPVLYVPPSMPAMNLLIRMQSTRIHMALVVDEYGGTDGLVTIEDLVEQIVGQIEDEHDEDEAAHITRDAKLGLVVSARATLAELEAALGEKLAAAGTEGDVDTVGGLLFMMLDRIPARGEIVRHASGVEFEVLEADPRRVKKLRVHAPRTDKPATPGSDGGSAA